MNQKPGRKWAGFILQIIIFSGMFTTLLLTGKLTEGMFIPLLGAIVGAFTAFTVGNVASKKQFVEHEKVNNKNNPETYQG